MRLRRLRETLGVSQQEMAKFLQVSPGAIALWENAQRTIPGPVMLLIALFEEELSSAPFPHAFLNPPLKLGIQRLLELGKPIVTSKSRSKQAATEEGLDPAVADKWRLPGRW